MKNMGPLDDGADIPRYDSSWVTVNHGSTAGTARPTGASVVLWVGTVTPTNMANGDFWADVS